MAIEKIKGTSVVTVAEGTDESTGISYSVIANKSVCACSFLRESAGTVVSGWITLYHLPEEYRPKTTIFAYFCGADGNVLRARVNQDGAIALYSPQTGQIAGCITYPI